MIAWLRLCMQTPSSSEGFSASEEIHRTLGRWLGCGQGLLLLWGWEADSVSAHLRLVFPTPRTELFGVLAKSCSFLASLNSGFCLLGRDCKNSAWLSVTFWWPSKYLPCTAWNSADALRIQSTFLELCLPFVWDLVPSSPCCLHVHKPHVIFSSPLRSQELCWLLFIVVAAFGHVSPLCTQCRDLSATFQGKAIRKSWLTPLKFPNIQQVCLSILSLISGPPKLWRDVWVLSSFPSSPRQECIWHWLLIIDGNRHLSFSLPLCVCVCLFLSLSHAFPVYMMSSCISREARNLSTRGQVQMYFICITQNMQTDNSAHNLTEILDPSLAFHRLPRSWEAWTEPHYWKHRTARKGENLSTQT